MDELQPAEMVWGLINTHTLARCMHVIAEFGVADAPENRASSARVRRIAGVNRVSVGANHSDRLAILAGRSRGRVARRQ